MSFTGSFLGEIKHTAIGHRLGRLDPASVPGMDQMNLSRSFLDKHVHGSYIRLIMRERD